MSYVYIYVCNIAQLPIAVNVSISSSVLHSLAVFLIHRFSMHHMRYIHSLCLHLRSSPYARLRYLRGREHLNIINYANISTKMLSDNIPHAFHHLCSSAGFLIRSTAISSTVYLLPTTLFPHIFSCSRHRRNPSLPF